MLQRCSRTSLSLLVTLGFAAGCTQTAPQPAPPQEPAAAPAPDPSAAGAAQPAGTEVPPASDEATHRITTAVEGSGADRWLVTTVTPGEGYKCNMEYPRWQVQIDETAPAAAGARVTREQATTFEESMVTFRVPLTDPAAAGEITGKLRISVCNDEACLMPTENVAWTVAAAQ